MNLLVDYDPRWEAAFLEEKARIAEALSSIIKGIEHYGSTSVPGMRAKPILDILVGVDPLEDWEKCKASLEALGYDYAAQAGVPGHYVFGRGRDSTERTHLVHIVQYQGDSWRGNLVFRDALRNHAGLRAEYVRRKEDAIAAAPRGRASYNELKRAFIDDVKEMIEKIQSQATATPPRTLSH